MKTYSSKVIRINWSEWAKLSKKEKEQEIQKLKENIEDYKFKYKKKTKEKRIQIKLDQNTVDFRKKDYYDIEKKRGYIQKLANKWFVSHSQVKRFIKKYC